MSPPDIPLETLLMFADNLRDSDCETRDSQDETKDSQDETAKIPKIHPEIPRANRKIPRANSFTATSTCSSPQGEPFPIPLL
jgi:hypothetical protein